MIRTNRTKSLALGATAIAAGAITVMLAGCSTKSSATFPSPGAAMANGQPTGPPPNVLDCTMTKQASPTTYVCNGKTYTSFQLTQMRADYEKKQQSGQ